MRCEPDCWLQCTPNGGFEAHRREYAAMRASLVPSRASSSAKDVTKAPQRPRKTRCFRSPANRRPRPSRPMRHLAAPQRTLVPERLQRVGPRQAVAPGLEGGPHRIGQVHGTRFVVPGQPVCPLEMNQRRGCGDRSGVSGPAPRPDQYASIEDDIRSRPCRNSQSALSPATWSPHVRSACSNPPRFPTASISPNAPEPGFAARSGSSRARARHAAGDCGDSRPAPRGDRSTRSARHATGRRPDPAPAAHPGLSPSPRPPDHRRERLRRRRAVPMPPQTTPMRTAPTSATRRSSGQSRDGLSPFLPGGRIVPAHMARLHPVHPRSRWGGRWTLGTSATPTLPAATGPRHLGA